MKNHDINTTRTFAIEFYVVTKDVGMQKSR